MNPIKHLTEYQAWLLRDALEAGALYFPAPDDLEDGKFRKTKDPKGYAITSPGEKRTLKRLIELELLKEASPGRFELTDRGLEYAQYDKVPIRKSY